VYEVLRTPEFEEWMDTLDPASVNRVSLVLARMEEGNWGDYKPLPGVSGIFERRLMGRGAGIRLYFCRQSSNVVLALIGGDKASQQRGDIAKAGRLSEHYI
jgi:putative addiction module killer protein